MKDDGRVALFLRTGEKKAFLFRKLYLSLFYFFLRHLLPPSSTSVLPGAGRTAVVYLTSDSPDDLADLTQSLKLLHRNLFVPHGSRPVSESASCVFVM